MNTIKKHIKLTLVIFCISIFFIGCMDEERRLPSPTQEEKMMTFSVQIPGATTFQPYRLTEQEENEVKTIEILLFDTKGNYVYKPIYTDNVSTNTTDSRFKTFSVKMPEGEYSMVVLANARHSLGEIIKELETGTPKESIISKLLVSNNGKWNTSPTSDGYKQIPLWGETDKVTIGKSNYLSLKLVRMVSKIDVVLTSETAQSKLKLESVRLYNYNNQGRIVPEAANWNATEQYATAPSIPPTAQKPSNPVSAPLVYEGAAINEGISCINEIYTFEAEAGNVATLQENVCLVIGGIYEGQQKPSYYRIDFAKTASGQTTYLPLLRNHSYKVNISKISAAGVSTPEEAFYARPVNIEAEVIKWNDAIISDIVFNGQYMLGVSQGQFTFPRTERTQTSEDNTLTVTTDYPEGWIVEKIIDEQNNTVSWLKMTIEKGSTGIATETKLLLSTNSTGNIRKAFIHIKAGRLNYQVQITQDIKGEADIKILDVQDETEVTELLFTSSLSGRPEPKSFIVKWIPASDTVTIEGAGDQDNFIFDPNYDLPGVSETSITNGIGQKIFTVCPIPLTAKEIELSPFHVKDTRISFTVFDGQEKHTKAIHLQQMANIVRTENLASTYKLDGSTHKISIASNAKWKVKSVKENFITEQGNKNLLNLKPSDNLIEGTTGGQAYTQTHTTLSFTVNNLPNAEGEIVIILGSDDTRQPLDNITITLKLLNQYIPGKHKGWATTNIYYDPKLRHLTFKDTELSSLERQIQGVYFKWGSLWGISPVGNYNDFKLLFPPSGESNFVSETNYSYTAIPYINETIQLHPNNSRAYLYEVTDAELGIGDICKYLTDKKWAPPGKWRMPTQTEINGSFSTTSNEWGPVTTTNSFGTEVIPHAFAGLPPIFTLSIRFPASGMFHNQIQIPVNVGTGAYIWTSTGIESKAYQLEGYKGNPAKISERNRSDALTVRCVKE